MNSFFTKAILTTALAFSIAACELGSGASNKNNNTNFSSNPAFISSGSISGFGSVINSVIVNGVAFETDTATFDIDDESDTQDDLAIGMIVQVSGTINDDRTTGTATHIRYNDELQGPIALTSLTDPDVDGNRTFTVLGINVIIDNNNTLFDVASNANLPAEVSFDFDNIAEGNNVEISGFVDSNSALNATRLELKDFTFAATDSLVEIKGLVTNLNAGTFSLAGSTLTIDTTNATLEDMTSGLQNGMFVDIKGTFNDTENILIANKIQLENNTIDTSGQFEIEGIITNYDDDSSFLVNGLPVNADSAILEPDSLILSDDIRVEIEATLSINTTLLAVKVTLKE